MRATLPFEVAIEKPCEESWAAMAGGARARHCELCDKKVHDFASMTSREIAKLLAQSDGRVCARMTRRENGSLVTLDAGSLAGGGRLAAQMAVSASLLLGASSGMAQAGVEKPVAAPICTPKAKTGIASMAVGEQASAKMQADEPAMMGEVTVSSGAVLPTAQAQVNAVMDEGIPEGLGQAVLTGTVLKADGSGPLAGATISIRRAGIEVVSTNSRDGGQFRISVAPGIYDIRIKKDALEAITFKGFQLGEGEQQLPPTSTSTTVTITAEIGAGYSTMGTVSSTVTRSSFWYIVRHPVVYFRHLKQKGSGQ